jgi:enoyl-CoA hydratase
MSQGQLPGRPEALAHLEVVDHVATITLADPDRRNCVSAALSQDVADLCRQIAGSREVGAVVLRAQGPVFSAGGDVDTLTANNTPTEQLYRGFAALAALGVPVLAAVNGPAIGAGMNFALACDVIVAAESAYFDARFLDIGIHPGGGYLWSLQQRVGRQAAAAVTLFGERVSAEHAEQLGLVWRTVPDVQLTEVTTAMAVRAVGVPRELMRRTKGTLAASVAVTNRRDAVDLETVAQEWSMAQPEFAAGVQAMRQRLQSRRSTAQQ